MEAKLIDFVSKNPILYEKQYRSLRYHDEKKTKWEQISRILRKDPNLVRQKWKHLRDTYVRCYKQRIKSREEGDTLATKTWVHYSAMSFLNSTLDDNIIFKTEDTFYEDETDAAVNNLNQEEHIDQEQQDQQFDVLYTEEQDVSNEADFEIENFDLNDYVKKIDHPTTTKPVNTTTTTTTSNNSTNNTTQEQDFIRRKKYDKDALIQEACQEMTSLLQNAKKHFTPPSSNQVFFNSIALQVEEAQLPALSQMRLQQRILELVTLEIVNHQQSTMQQL